MTRKPTIYDALAEKLGRNPTHAEIKAECIRIIEEGRLQMIERNVKVGK